MSAALVHAIGNPGTPSLRLLIFRETLDSLPAET